MGEILLILGLLMAGVAVYLIATMILSVNQDQQALVWATEDEPVKSKSKFIELSRPLVHKFCLGWAQRIKSPAYRKRISKAIASAGLQREINADEFIGLQILWGFLFPILLVLMDFTLELGYPLPLVIAMGAFGFYFPYLHANTERKNRTISVVADLPFFIDLLALSTEAGLDFIGSIQRVVEKSENSVLGEELAQVLRDLKLGSTRAEALRAMALRLDVPEVTSFITVLIDSDATGTSIGLVLKQQAVQMRVERFTRAEKAGARASQTILIPLMLFILPAVFIMVFGPVIIKFMTGGNL